MFGHVAQTTLQEIKGAPSRLAHRHALARTCSARRPTVSGGPSRSASGGGRRKSRSHSRSSSTRAIESSPRPPSPSCNSSGRSSRSLARGTRSRRISLTPSAGVIFAFIGGILWALCLPPADILPDSSGSSGPTFRNWSSSIRPPPERPHSPVEPSSSWYAPATSIPAYAAARAAPFATSRSRVSSSRQSQGRHEGQRRSLESVEACPWADERRRHNWSVRANGHRNSHCVPTGLHVPQHPAIPIAPLQRKIRRRTTSAHCLEAPYAELPEEEREDVS